MSDEKLSNLKQTLTSVENELLYRKVDRQDDMIDHTLDTINRGVEAGAIDLEPGEGEPKEEPPPAEDGEEGGEDNTD